MTKRTPSRRTKRPAPTASRRSIAGRTQLARLLLRVASHRSERPDNVMAKTVLLYIGHDASCAPEVLVRDLAYALAENAEAGADLLTDVGEVVGEKDSKIVAASMGGSVVEHVREIAQALLLGADELERLAKKLGYAANTSVEGVRKGGAR